MLRAVGAETWFKRHEMTSCFRPLLLLPLLVLAGCSLFSAPMTRDISPRQRGLASYYGDEFASKHTASGELYDALS